MQTKILLFVLIGFVFTSKAQHKLTIQIDVLSNNEGVVLLEFLDGNKERVQGASQIIEDNKSTFVIDNLKSGKYAFKYFHDENMNDKLDANWIGMPVEGFGFSNNAKGRFGPPAFDKMLFELNKDTTVNCTVIYL